MTPITNFREALRRIEAHTGPPETLQLPISHSLLDPAGMNMAIITDAILGRGWWPDDFEEAAGYRLYKYKAMED
jgi:hypothetical protein